MILTLLLLLIIASTTVGFVSPPSCPRLVATRESSVKVFGRRSASVARSQHRDDKSKRQHRVGQVVRAEVASILHRGYEIKVRSGVGAFPNPCLW